MSKRGVDHRMTEADLARAATDLIIKGFNMGQLRTANKRHNRALAALQARKSAAKTSVAAPRPAAEAAS